MIRVLSAVILVAGVARADVPPPNGEPCVLEKVRADGEECSTCSADHTAPDRCAAPAGFTLRCRTAGASVWTEIYCRSAMDKAAAPAVLPGASPAPSAAPASPVAPAAPVKAVDDPKKDKSCSSAPVGLLAIAAFLARRYGPRKGPTLG